MKRFNRVEKLIIIIGLAVVAITAITGAKREAKAYTHAAQATLCEGMAKPPGHGVKASD